MYGAIATLISIVFFININESNSYWNGEMYAEKGETCECGLSPALSTYIINGKEVEDMTMYPWLVSLHDISNELEKDWGNCGGALISQDTVVTAAHCLFTTSNCSNDAAHCLSPLDSFRVGLLGPSHSQPAKKIRVSKLIPHPEFDLKVLKYDIAVIKLAEAVPCTDYSRPICLTNEDLIKKKNIKKLQIAGWGRVKSFESTDVLRDGTTDIVDSSICRIFKTNPSQTICALGKVEYACHGDSGSPAVVRNFDQFFIVGVTSGGRLFCPFGLPMFYTRTDFFHSFIIQAMNSK